MAFFILLFHSLEIAVNYYPGTSFHFSPVFRAFVSWSPYFLFVLMYHSGKEHMGGDFFLRPSISENAFILLLYLSDGLTEYKIISWK